MGPNGFGTCDREKSMKYGPRSPWAAPGACATSAGIRPAFVDRSARCPSSDGPQVRLGAQGTGAYLRSSRDGPAAGEIRCRRSPSGSVGDRWPSDPLEDPREPVQDDVAVVVPLRPG